MMLRPPAILVRFARRLPEPLTSLPFVLGLDAARRLSWLTPPPELEGRRFAITVEDLGLRACFGCRHGAFHRLSGQAPELELRANVADFLALMRGTADADTLFLSLLPRLIGMGVSAIKIEGRQRSPAYVSQVVATLRAALDAAQADPARFSARPDWQAALVRHAEGAHVTQGAFDRPWK